MVMAVSWKLKICAKKRKIVFDHLLKIIQYYVCKLQVLFQFSRDILFGDTRYALTT